MKKNQAFKRVIKKLSAVRATLGNDERQALDNIIVDEVAAHTMKITKAAKSAKAPKTARTNEVAAHTMKVAKVAKTARAARAAKVAKAPEA